MLEKLKADVQIRKYFSPLKKKGSISSNQQQHTNVSLLPPIRMDRNGFFNPKCSPDKENDRHLSPLTNSGGITGHKNKMSARQNENWQRHHNKIIRVRNNVDSKSTIGG